MFSGRSLGMLVVIYRVLSACLLVQGVIGSSSLDDTVLMLKGQVQALLDNKQQELSLNTQIEALRDELKELRTTSKRLKDLELKLEWLEGSVSETRGQLSQQGAALQGLRSLPRRIQSVQKEVGTQAVQLQDLSLKFLQLNTKVSTSLMEQAQENKPKEIPNSIDPPNHHEGGEEKRYRHHRVLRKQVESLEDWTRKLQAGQDRIDGEIKTLATKVKDVEGNFSSESGGFRASTLELLESVQGLETKVDNGLSNLQRELSRTELSLAQNIQQMAVTKGEQETQRATVRALSEGMSSLQGKFDKLSHTPNKTEIFRDKERDGLKLVSELSRIVTEYDNVISQLPYDCSNLGNVTGLEMIRPGGEGRPTLVSCENGWTIIQRRQDGSVQFNRDWEEYANGFGTPSGEFWIGNEVLHRLTKDNNTSLRIEMMDIYGKEWWAEYSMFRVGSRKDWFKLEVSGFSGNASDALNYQNNMEFSAKDQDRDISNTHCALNYEGGWWFSHCQHANLNGRYNLGLTWFHASNNEWIAVAQSTMKIKTKSL